jgi:hypothetical protein
MSNWEAAGLPKRNAAADTESERRPVKPPKDVNGTGFTQQMNAVNGDMIMQKAIADKMAQGLREAAGAKAQEAAAEERPDRDDADLDVAEDRGAEAEDDLETLRARRRQQMKEAQEKRQKYQQLGHGTYDEIVEEEFLKTVTSSSRSVVHFYHRHFEKCKVMDMHLEKCAKKFFGTRFTKLNSEKAPFFVEKLNVKVLPCVIVFVDGVAKGRQLGFDGLGVENFPTHKLAWRLYEFGGIEEDFGPDDEF